VFFRATVTDASVNTAANRTSYDESWHEVTYLWDFGDPGRVSDKASNVAAQHNDLNKGRGREVGHVFTRPGTHTVTCTAIGPNGLIGTATTSVTVKDPDTVFAGAKTILVNAAGAADGDYPSATVVTSADAARTALLAQAAECRILFRRGETFSTSGPLMTWGNTPDNFYVGAYGTGADPRINSYGHSFAITDSAFTGDFVIQGVDLRGNWNSLNETGTLGVPFVRLRSYSTARMHVLEDCHIEGGYMGVYLPSDNTGDTQIPSTHICNTTITGWADYAVYGWKGQNQAVSLEGSAFIRKSGAWEGGHNSFSLRNSQGSMRIDSRMRVSIRVCDFFSKCSWTLRNGVPGQQPALRLNADGVTGHTSHVDRCAFEGGNNLFEFHKDNTNSAVTNGVFERCVMVGGPKTERFIRLNHTGVTIRNNIMILPNQPRFWNWQAVVDFSSASSAPNEPVKILNNTILMLLNDANRNGQSLTTIGGGSAGSFNALTIANNVLWTPNATGQGTTDPELSTDLLVTIGGVWAPRYTGHVWYQSTTLDTSYATPASIVTTFVPQAGSPVLGGASSNVPYDDFYGVVRSATDDDGAVSG
jgi:hypothetical protein